MSSGRKSAVGALLGQVTRRVRLDALELDPRTQLRAQRSPQTVEDYAERMARGASGDVVDPDGGTWPAVVVYYDASARTYHVADGHHRVEAARAAGLDEIQADVRAGGLRDAVLYAASANTLHGLRPSRADKRRAIRALLEDEEWRTWSDREIGRRCGASHTTVGTVRAELEAERVIEAAPVRQTPQGPVDIEGVKIRQAEGRERKRVAQAAPVATHDEASSSLSPLPLEQAADTLRFSGLAALRGAGVAVLLVEWTTREELWALVTHGYDALADRGALLLRAPQGELLAWLVLQLHSYTRDGRLDGPRLTILDGEIWATWTRGPVEIPSRLTTTGAVAAHLQGSEGRLVRLVSG